MNKFGNTGSATEHSILHSISQKHFSASLKCIETADSRADYDINVTLMKLCNRIPDEKHNVVVFSIHNYDTEHGERKQILFEVTRRIGSGTRGCNKEKSLYPRMESKMSIG